MINPLKLNPRDFLWEVDHIFAGRLFSDMSVGGVDFHVEAIEVDTHNSLSAVEPELQDRIDGVMSFDGQAAGYQTLELEGRPHFLVVFPYQT